MILQRKNDLTMVSRRRKRCFRLNAILSSDCAAEGGSRSQIGFANGRRPPLRRLSSAVSALLVHEQLSFAATRAAKASSASRKWPRSSANGTNLALKNLLSTGCLGSPRGRIRLCCAGNPYWLVRRRGPSRVLCQRCSTLMIPATARRFKALLMVSIHRPLARCKAL